MTNLIENILNKKFDEAKELFESRINDIAAVKLHEAKKHTSAKMSVEGTAFIGMPGSNAEKMKRGINEDELEEMDLSREKPDYDSIEDKRKGQIVQNAGKKSLPGTQDVNDEGKGDLKMTTINKTMNETAEQLDEARIKILKARVRGGKVQRRKRISNVEGFKMADGQLKRMSPAERRRRKLGQKRGKIKRKSKMRMAMMKRKRSLRKRTSIGL